MDMRGTIIKITGSCNLLKRRFMKVLVTRAGDKFGAEDRNIDKTMR